jgi:DHA2 family multidrug resistance protein
MRGSLGATLTDVAWVITAYAIANVIVIPMTAFTAIWKTKLFCRFNNYFHRRFFFYVVMLQIWMGPSVLFKVLEVALLVTAQTIITESYPIAKNGTSHLRNGCDCRTYARPTIRRLYCGSLFLALYFINIPLGIIATLLTLSFVKVQNMAKN